jgi:hypothetical protein
MSESKDDEIAAWRKQQLVLAGWEPSIALELAYDFSLDLRLAEAAIKCGDPERALYLLSVTDEC